MFLFWVFFGLLFEFCFGLPLLGRLVVVVAVVLLGPIVRKLVWPFLREEELDFFVVFRLGEKRELLGPLLLLWALFEPVFCLPLCLPF